METHCSTSSGKLAATNEVTPPPMLCPTNANRSHPNNLLSLHPMKQTMDEKAQQQQQQRNLTGSENVAFPLKGCFGFTISSAHVFHDRHFATYKYNSHVRIIVFGGLKRIWNYSAPSIMM